MISSNYFKKNRAFILVNVLVFAVIALVMTTAIVNWGATLLKNTQQLTNREQAFDIAEAGIDYYRWHLAHNQTDYYDGNASTTSPGPYIHLFQDKNGVTIGQFSLTITPPATGTTVVTIASKGTVVADANLSRTIQTKLAIPSFAKYAVVANDNMRFGSGTEVFGPIQSNYGVHFDGLAHNIISSSITSYIDPDLNDGVQRYGVYTTGDPTPPTVTPTRTDIFMAGRQFPVSTVDFAGITTNLSQIKATAQTSNSYYSSSGSQGYHIILKTNDTYDIYKVTSLQGLSGQCTSDGSSQTGWGSWSIQNQTLVASNKAFPSSGVIFVEDHLWIDGSINTARLTIAAGAFPASPSTYKSITVNGNLTYTNYDGTDVLALISQDDINVGYNSLDTQRIDAALIAQNGRVGRYYYSSSCGTSYKRTLLTLYGMIASSLRYGFAYTDGTGYQTRSIVYDGNLLYGPPPSFPLSSSQYSTISWGEVVQ
jgi:type II secretory pathway pseudopilin PulG